MTSNSPYRIQDHYKRAIYQRSSSDFVTSPIDHHRRNALQDRELREYLKHSENFNKLVKAGILLTDGRVVCSDEQWMQTREVIIKKIQATIYGRSKSASPDTKLRRSRTSVTAVSTNSESFSSPKPTAKSGRTSSYQLSGKLLDTASQSSDELWGNMSNNVVPGPSKEAGPHRKGSTYSREGISRRQSQSIYQTASGKAVSGKTQSIGGMKNDRVLHQSKKSLRDQDMSNRQKIHDEQRRNDRKKPGHERQHQSKERTKIKDQATAEETGQRRMDQVDEDVQDITKQVLLRNAAVLTTLEQSRDALRAMKDEVGESALQAVLQGTRSENIPQDADNDPLDGLLLEFLNRQDRLFRALGERNVEELSGFLELVPKSLTIDQKQIFSQYSPNARLRKIMDDLLNGLVTEDVFYREAANLVKLMSPPEIIRYIGMCMAFTTPRRILRVSLKSSTNDRYGLTWSSDRPSRDKAMSMASRLVDDAIEQARNVHTYLTRDNELNFSLLGIGGPDPLVAAPRHVSVGDLTIEPYNDEHVSFSDKSVILRRPLEDGLAVADLKPVLDRPPTPIPDAERVRAKSRERLERLEAESAFVDAKKKARELVQEIRRDSDRRLRRKIRQEGLKHEKHLFEDVQKAMLTGSHSEKLKDRVYMRLADWKAMESERNRHLARVVESISDLVPHIVGTQRDRFVRSVSRQVSSIVAVTLKQAQDLMQEAMSATEEQTIPATASDEDSDEFESVSSALVGDPVTEEQLGEIQESEREERVKFKPTFGSDELKLSQNVIIGGLAAISVKHSEDGHGHEGHSHAPPASHMKQFFKNRASMPAIPAMSDSSAAAKKKRHSMPAALPECMDPNQLHGRHSFLSVTQPDVKSLPEYRHKTRRQVETVVQEHSVFGRMQQADDSSPLESDDEAVLVSEDLGRPDEEIVPKSRRRRQPLPVAEAPLDEERDSVSELPPTDDDERRRESPKPVASTPVAHQPAEPEVLAVSSSAATAKTQSLTPSRMMLRCDSDPRLSLRASTAEVHVDVHEHSALCEHHESHDEPAAELQVLESSAFGINAERTASTSRLAGSEAVVTDARRSGSAEGGQLLHSDIDSDDETELRVRHPNVNSDAPSPYY